jgi:YVTN family beta-propeller protein
MVIEAVQAANADLSFAGLDAAGAVTTASEQASQDPAVMMAIQEAMVTPTSTPTPTPTVTPTPVPRFVLATNVDENTVSFIDARTNMVVDDVAVGANPIGMALTPDGEHAFVVNRGTLATEGFSILETRSRTEVRRFDDYEPDILDESVGVAVTPLGIAYVANRSSGSVDVIDVNQALSDPASARVTRIVGVGVQPTVVVAARSESFAYVSLVGGQGVAVINTSNNEVESTVNLPTQVFSLALSPDDRTIWVTRSPNVVSVIDAELARTDPSEAAESAIDIAVGDTPLGVAVAPAGDFVYVTNAIGQSLSVIRSSSRTVINTLSFSAGSSPTGIAIALDGRTAYVGLRAMGAVAVVDTGKARDPEELPAVVTTVPVGARPQVIVVTDLP